MRNFFLLNKKTIRNNESNHEVVDHYKELEKLVKEARTKQNLTIEELSIISKIPEKTIISIEENNKNTRPKYPFIRSILIKLEECLGLKKKYIRKISN